MTHHKATANVVLLLQCLLEHPGWMTLADLADATSIHRTTLEAMLGELVDVAWVEAERNTRFRLGPGLPRLGLTFQEQLLNQMAGVRARWDALATHPATTHPQGDRPC